MRIRTIILLAALTCLALLAGQPSPPRPGRRATGAAGEKDTHDRKLQERFLYVSTVAQSPADPDFIAVIGADPRRADFGKIVNRIDMPDVGDELRHFGYSA